MKEINDFLEEKIIGDMKLTDYIAKDGFVWKGIIIAMREYGLQEYNRGIEDGKIIAEHGTTMYFERVRWCNIHQK